MSEYKLEKWLWTEDDFEQMGWHDAQIYGLAFLSESFELVIDIDYILEWVHPAGHETYFKFWVAPATLVFENIYGLEIDLEAHNISVEIQDIHRKDPKKVENGEYAGRDEWQWLIEAQEGEISLRATGYKQYFRREPVLSNQQSLEMSVRGGLSFSRSLPSG